MSSTNVVCGMKTCRNYSDNGCMKKAIILSAKGKCLSAELGDGSRSSRTGSPGSSGKGIRVWSVEKAKPRHKPPFSIGRAGSSHRPRYLRLCIMQPTKEREA